ncbi:MAG: ExbD/TolR family protein [Bdellovibrio sp.]|jgi:biopolymer transport protein ExbD
MAYRRKAVDYTPKHKTFALNITSMTDMFTILLVFLLQTYSTADFQVDPEQGISLPLSNVQTNPTKAVKVSLTKTALIIEGRTIASLEQGAFARTDLETSDTNFIRPLFSELEKFAKEKVDDQSVKDGKVLFQADSSLSYDMIRKVMYTASMAGFPKLKMATVVGN